LTTLGWTLFVTILGSAAALSLSGSLLLLSDVRRQRVLPYLLGYATGTLLGASFLELIPHALRRQETSTTLGLVLAAIVFFFLLERLLLWRHCHEIGCRVHGTRAPLILVGDALHNLADGAVIAAAFLTSKPLGFATTLAVFAHEIPQEVGDFAILLSAGYTRKKALVSNAVSASSALLGAGAAYAFLGEVQSAIPVVMSVSAASFLYVAVADLFPELHREEDRKRGALQVVLLLAGITTVALLGRTAQ
jgi:zinc and cadmium transporter